MATIIDELNKNAGKYCTKPVLRYRTFQQDYARVLDYSDRFAQGLRDLGFKTGDLIMLYLPNISEFTTAYYGCMKAGLRVIPMNLSFRKHEIKYILNHPELKGLVYWVRFENKIAELLEQINRKPKLIRVGEFKELESEHFESIIERSGAISTYDYPDDTDEAVILYSSGASNNPKGAVLSHYSIHKSAEAVVREFGFTSEDKVIGAVPLYTFLGHTVIMNASLLAGAEVILHTRFKPEEILQSIFRTKATIMIGTPFMYRQLAECDISATLDLSTLRFGIVSGDRIDCNLVKQFKEKFDFPLIQSFGSIETTSLVSYNVINEENDCNDIGKAFEGVKIEVVDSTGKPFSSAGDKGELTVNCEMNMVRYFSGPRNDETTSSSEWVYPGDIVYVDEIGRIKYIGHKSDIIMKGNFQVHASEVEEMLLMHDAVRESAVTGVNDPEKNQELKAFVVLKPDMKTTEEELKSHCSESLPVYKIPKHIKIVDYLPKTISGKVVKRFLK